MSSFLLVTLVVWHFDIFWLCTSIVYCCCSVAPLSAILGLGVNLIVFTINDLIWFDLNTGHVTGRSPLLSATYLLRRNEWLPAVRANVTKISGVVGTELEAASRCPWSRGARLACLLIRYLLSVAIRCRRRRSFAECKRHVGGEFSSVFMSFDRICILFALREYMLTGIKSTPACNTLRTSFSDWKDRRM